MQLNEIGQELEAKLPPMDTRRRLDMRALERGDYVQVLTCFQPSRVHTTSLTVICLACRVEGSFAMHHSWSVDPTVITC